MVFRTLNKEEIPAAVKLWVEVFQMETSFFQTLLDGDAPDAVSLGAFDGDRLVSSVHVFIRWFRDREGRPQKVGSIGSVSTLPEYRSKGCSGRLLQMAIREMGSRECIWSYLGTGVNDHYAKQGWRTVSTPFFRGTLDDLSEADQLEKATITEELIDEMAALHMAYTRKRPMANARSRYMWLCAVWYRVTGDIDEVYVSRTGKELDAYLVVRQHADQIELIEGICKEGSDKSLRDLVRLRLAIAASQGIVKVESKFAEDSEGHAAFVESCRKVTPAEDRSWMALPIADRISWPDLAALHADPRGRRSDLDNF